ncbi:MAG: ASKHA domain-containing protein [Spirochaetota bacterium]
MSKITCRIEQNGRIYTVEAAAGMRLLDVLNMVGEIEMDAPCGGNGTCGKCKVRVVSEGGDCGLSAPNGAEHSFLSPEELEGGVRLACRAVLTGNCHIAMLGAAGEADILSDSAVYQGEVDPPIEKTYLELPAPSIEDQRPDSLRLVESLWQQLNAGGADSGRAELHPVLALSQRQQLPDLLRTSGYKISVVHNHRQIYSLQSGDTTARHFGIAVDVGTTTVVAYLVSLNSGGVVDTVSGLNKQKTFGGDVISRIEYAMGEEGGLAVIQERIRSQIETMGRELLRKNRLQEGDVSVIAVAGNTTMMHLFTGLSPAAIASAPFIPVSLEEETIPAAELGFETFRCPVFLLPSLSAYVGADISAGIVASGILERETLTLLVDFGTNGEIVLGNREQLFTCSTAAGPAFEGAHISRGMGGIAGAINSVYLEQDELFWTTIGGKPPQGICGSGIFDIAGLLVSTGAADYTGRILTPEEAERPEAAQLLRSYVEENGEPAIRLAGGGHTADLREILFTQRDLREVQLAKAAIAAGIESLLHAAGSSYSEVDKIFIAGGFGNYIDTHSAVKLGLFPRERLESIESIGNSAGKGAVLSLLSKKVSEELARIQAKSRYVELSTDAFFQSSYIEQMYFPVIE